MLCVKNTVLEGGLLAIPPDLVLAHCFCLAHPALVSPFSLISPPCLFSPLIFSQAELSLSICMNTAEFH